MLLFLSTYTNKVDKKGRVSVPSPFRDELAAAGSQGLIVFPHPDLNCIEAWDRERLGRYAETLDELDPDDAQFDAVSTLMAASRHLTFDGDGRVILPGDMMAGVGIDEQAVFAGRGQTFQIWAPGAFEDYESGASGRVASAGKRMRLAPSRPRSTGGDRHG